MIDRTNNVSYFDRVTDKTPESSIGWTDALKLITDEDFLKSKISTLRGLDKEKYDEEKKRLPAVIFQGTFHKRAKTRMERPTGFVVIDLDHIDSDSMGRVKDAFREDPYCWFCFVSPSGHGLKVGYRDESVQDAKTYEQAFKNACEHVKTNVGYGEYIDPKTKDISRLTFLSYDVNAYVNVGAKWMVNVVGNEVSRDEQVMWDTGAVIGEGERDEFIFLSTCKWYRMGHDKQAAYWLAERMADRCEGDFSHEDAHKKVESAWQACYEESEHPEMVLKKMNARFAFCQRFACVIDKRFVKLLQPSGVNNCMFNHYVKTQTNKGQPKWETWASFWLKHPQREDYDDLVFRPNGKCADNEYNLWKGLGVEPKKNGSCEMFKRHLWENIAQKDEEYYEFLMNWMSGIVRDSEGGPKTMVVIRGGQGTGKSLIGDYLIEMIGREHAQQIIDTNELTSSFNASFAYNIFVHNDEASWGGDPKTMNRLKGMVTQPYLSVEEKFQPRYHLKNCLHILTTSNEDRPMRVERDDRRIVAIDTGAREQAAPKEFFKKLVKEMEGDGPGALLWELLQRKGPTDPDQPNKSQAKVEMQLESGDPYVKVLVEWLENERTGARAEGDYVQVITNTELVEGFRLTAHSIGLSNNVSLDARKIKKELKRILGDSFVSQAGSGRSLNNIRERWGVELDPNEEESMKVMKACKLPSICELGEKLLG